MPTRVLDPEASVQQTEEVVKPSYKQITEKELHEEEAAGDQKAVKMVQENGDTHHDEAEEKMLTPTEGAEVKFISGDQANGDAKVDVECIQQVFTGMRKDELMKYAKDPFWVRLRWTLFVLFWLLWTAMLVGAIVIVIAAPKCAAPVPKTWWEEGPLVDVDLPTSVDDSTPLLKSLKDVGANAVVVHIPDNYDLYKDNYTYSDIKAFVEKAKEQNLHVILNVQANSVPVTSNIFVSGENADSEFADYFIWADGKEGAEPNNWKAIVNGSAWNLSTKRNQYYLSQFGKDYADLNFDNMQVRNLFSEALENLVKTGITGIKLRHAKYLLVDKSFKDEAFTSVPGFVHTNYGFYNHMRTSNRPGLGELIQPWKETVLNNTEAGVFYIAEDLDRNTFLVDDVLIPQLPCLSKKLSGLNKEPTQNVKDLYTDLKSIHTESNGIWPNLQFDSLDAQKRSEHNMLVMLLPGVPELSTAQLLGQNSSLVDQSKVILTARQNPSVKFGTFDVQLLANETVIGYSRLKPGNPGLIVLYNTNEESMTVDLKPLLGTVETVTVVLLSDNYQESAVSIKSTLPANSVPISSKSAILVSYIPASAN